MNIDPRQIPTFKEWSELMTLPLSKLLIVPLVQNEALWKEWALTVLQNPKILRFSPPDPRSFLSWQEWAIRFNQAVPL